MRTRRPARLSSALAVGAAWLALLLLSRFPAQRAALAAQLLGVALLLVGLGGWFSWTGPDHRVAGLAVGLLGGLTILAGGVIALTGPLTVSAIGEFVPGYVGVTLVALGVSCLCRGGERALLTAGAALLLIAIAIGAMVYGSSRNALLLAGVATIAAWDLGEQAVNLGEQVGRRPTTRNVELVHAAGTLAVGAVALGLVLGVRGVDVTGASLGALLVLLAAGLALSASLYN